MFLGSSAEISTTISVSCAREEHHKHGKCFTDLLFLPSYSSCSKQIQGEQGSSDLARQQCRRSNNTGVMQSVRVWTDKTDDNGDTWEAAIRHFNKVSVSSCFLMEINKGCLQPSIFGDFIVGEYIAVL